MNRPGYFNPKWNTTDPERQILYRFCLVFILDLKFYIYAWVLCEYVCMYVCLCVHIRLNVNIFVRLCSGGETMQENELKVY